METLIWPEKPSLSSRSPTSQNRVIGELIHGRDLALQLQTLLHRGSRTNGSHSAGEIAGEILRTFTESISALSSSSVEFGEVCDDGGSDDSISSKKRGASSKDGRGCYKRRKGSETWTKIAPSVEDTHSWRKYGQKEILNAKFPRCYFRCSHKPDQGCRATKQVQQMEDNQKMYHITYIGHHTCKKSLKSPQIIPESDPWEPLQNNQLENNLFAFGSVKQEVLLKKEDPGSDVFGPMMFGDGGHIESTMDNSLDDMNDLLINFVGFDDHHDFGFGEPTETATTVFSYNNDLL